jgi:phosphatidylserine/phosphatidylglycerophosphate/cardiolipin synthase-like enzyme
MTLRIHALAVCLLTCLCATFLRAQGIIINELYNSSGSDEWLELLVVTDSVDLRGWDLRDFSSGGSPQTPLTFSNASLWQNLRKGTLIVVGRPETVFPEDTDPGDYLLAIRANNALYISGNAFTFAGASDAVEIRSPGGVHQIGVSWGAANASSFSSPKVHFSGSVTSGNTVAFNGGAIALTTDPANWAFNTSTATQGAGNSPTNAAWITSLRANPDGSGAARVRPDTLMSGSPTDLTIIYRRDSSFTVTDLRLVLPAEFSWSHSVSSVSIALMTASISVTGDTIDCRSIAFTVDSALVTISQVVAPDSTAFYPIVVQSKAALEYRDVGQRPRVAVFGSSVSVSSVKGNDASGLVLRLGQLVTIRGIVSVANEFGGPSYVQDQTGGIGVFGSSFSTNVSVGDEVVVSGVLDQFNGLTELASLRLHGKPTTGNFLTPVNVTCSQLANDGAGGVEQYEGLLVRVNAVVLRDASGNPVGTWAVAGSGTNYKLLDGTDTVEVRADNNVDYVNAPAPQSVFDIVGVVGQFKTALPFIGGMQLMPRSTVDILATGPVIATPPQESQITPTSMHIGWKTVFAGSSRLRYGRTRALELGVIVPDDVQRTTHDVVLIDLSPATVYYVQAFSVAGADTSEAASIVVSTSSPREATGSINVYFNKDIYPGVAWQQTANGNQDLVSLAIRRINNARRSIDAALYSLSGTPGPGTDIANALINAKNRGVHVRVICENDNRTTSPFTLLANSGVALITDTFDPVNNGAGLMHNKFFVFDARGGAPESIWVWTGSWNPTDPGTHDDYQNVIEIQDPALAGAYLLEFNEMWGNDTDTPNSSVSRFGARKTDNTPHRFVIGGKYVESYFSPSDRATSHIVAAIDSARHSTAFALLTLTRADISGALTRRKTAGVKVRGVMDNSTDAGSQFSALQSAGVDVLLKSGTGSTGYLLHHKYGVIDAEDPLWGPVTITGSHNWTNSAENTNNENTLVIHDHLVANQYLQEFVARYYQYGGIDTITVGTAAESGSLPVSHRLFQNFPNPFNPETTLRFSVAHPSRALLRVYDLLGREVKTLVDGTLSAGSYAVRFNGRALASGVYVARLTLGSFVEQRKMLLVR